MDETTSRTNDVVAEALAWAKKAAESRDAAIAELLSRREQIDSDLKTLGYDAVLTQHNGNGSSKIIIQAKNYKAPVNHAVQKDARRFRNLKLADVGRMLLLEHGQLHGKQIEDLARAGGFSGGTAKFQNYLPLAFRRAGGFANIGKNIWVIDETIPPQR